MELAVDPYLEGEDAAAVQLLGQGGEVDKTASGLNRCMNPPVLSV
jgi:hypothetical protein